LRKCLLKFLNNTRAIWKEDSTFFEKISDYSLVKSLSSNVDNILQIIYLSRWEPTPLSKKIILPMKMLLISKERLYIKRLANMSHMRPKTKRDNIIGFAEL
jgi:hypothetical protein